MLKLPIWFEDAVSSAARINLRSSSSLAVIAPAVEHLAKRFMRQEDSVPANYFSDVDTRRAYLAYFFSTNVLKLHPVLDELARSDFFSTHKELRVLDIGTGVGTASIGLWMWLAQQELATALNIVATDISAEVCDEAARTMETFRKHIASPVMTFEKKALPMGRLVEAGLGTFDLIIAQNILVETPDSADMVAIAQGMLRPDGAMVLIEPASRYGSRTLLQCRDELISSGITIFAPCVRQATCPALVKESDWCHAASRWERPRFIRILDEQIGNLRLALKFSYVIAMKRALNIAATFPELKQDGLFRIVSDRIDEKGRKKLWGCGAPGRYFFEKQKRDTTETNRDFDDAHRYDLMSVDGFAPKANVQRLAPSSNAEIIALFEKKTAPPEPAAE